MMARLGDVCAKITDGSHNPPQGISCSEYLMLSSKNIYDDDISFDDPRYLSKENYETENKRTQISAGDILLTIVGTVGRAAVVSKTEKKICLQRSVAVIKPKQELIDSRFLMYQLQSMRTHLEQEARGVAQKGIYLRQVENLQIKVPSRGEQLQVVSNLDQISELISIRKQQLAKLDELVKSRFIELFDGKGYPTLKWNEVFNTTTGKLDSNAMVEDGEYPFFTCAKEVFRIDKYAFDQEALLLAGNNAAGKYDVKYYKGKFNAYQRTYVLGLKKDWSYQLFRYQLEDKLVYLQQQSLGGLTKYLTLKILGELEFIVPPMDKQNEFTAFVEQTDKSKLAIQESLAELETLKKALMQKYFG